MTNDLDDWVADYRRDGYCFPIDVMSAARAAHYRVQLEEVERERGASDARFAAAVFRYSHLVMPFADEITRLPAIVESVKALLGPDVLVWGTTFFVKEARTRDYVSWHQDLTYWDLDDVAEVTAWVALSPATVANGCMRFIPGSHARGIVPHRDTFAEENMLTRGQELGDGVDESSAVDVVLSPGQMSLHHGHMFHGSHANRSDDRRIGLAIRYITPAMRQLSGVKSHATLVAGEDRHGHFHLVPPPTELLAPADLELALRAARTADTYLYAGAEQDGRRYMAR
jgi:ectoine hydroxylase-related dioxygenase (phytanoyl-CoA dioxygenase family)